MANINSYADTLEQITGAAVEMAQVAKAFNETVTGNEQEVVITDDLVMPSYQNIIKRVERAENTVANLVNGKGVIETGDGTYRKIRVEPVSKPAGNIENLSPVKTFGINSNWFFESLQYPRCEVKIDLTSKIDEDSDRAYVNRVIVDVDQEFLTEDIKSELLNTDLKYPDLIKYLEDRSIEYREDRDEAKLPLVYEKYVGSFTVTSVSTIKNPTTNLGERWYYLSNLDYALVAEDGTTIESGHILSKGDKLRFNNSLFTVTEINQQEKRIKLDFTIGYETIGVYDVLNFYNEPFAEKIISVGIGIDEIDIIYVKGINEAFNILSKDWSNPIAFYTNDLIYDENESENFSSFYKKNVADFGKDWIARVKEGQIPSYEGITPNAPVLVADDIRVVQINTQLDATLDKKRYTEITTEIASVKSNISAVRNTIASNKNKLVRESNQNKRSTIQNTISSDTERLNSLTTQFGSLVDEMDTLLTTADVINYEPKYHLRGFFSIPDPQYADPEKKLGRQCIIGFEIMYRYLKTDNTGTTLNTFNFKNSNTGIVSTGVFSDWNIAESPILEKEYDVKTDSYNWTDEKLDGTHVTINQIDIAIRKGEKVELKVRSISEAGYPYNPLKSAWSNSVIIGFPENLTTDDSVTTILDTVKSDMTAVVLQETLTAAGLYTHLADSNSQYKHSADNIEYTETSTDSSGNTVVNTMSLAEKIRSLQASAESQTTAIEYTTADDNNNPVVNRIHFRLPDLPTIEKQEIQRATMNTFLDKVKYGSYSDLAVKKTFTPKKLFATQLSLS